MNTTRNDRLRAAFAPARSLEPTDAEVAVVVARVVREGRGSARRRWAVALVLVGGLLAAGAAAAAGGLLDVGTVISLSKEPQGDGLRYTGDRIVVATGRTPAAGRWQMSVAESDKAFCFGLELPDSEPGALSEGCGGASRSFDAGSVGGGDALPDVTLVHGPAPQEAAAVRVTAPGGFRRTVKTHEGPNEVPGDFYVVEIPRKGIHNALVTWVDKDGHAHGPGIYVPSTITYGPGHKRPQPPH